MTFSFLSLETYGVVLLRLIVATVLGALIGIERGSSKHDAGLRTHIIVCLGAASTMITSELIAINHGSITDITRLGAQVISGIGFLGVGCIIVTRNHIRGLTTAAGLWTTACIGLVIGAGFIEVAISIVALMMFTVFVLRPLSLKVRSSDLTYELTASLESYKSTDYVEALAKRNYIISSLKEQDGALTIIIHSDKMLSKNDFVREVFEIDGITGISEI